MTDDAERRRYNLNLALELATAGLPILPCWDNPRSNGKPQHKAPCFIGALDQATSDAGALRRWWQTWPDALPAIALERSGLIVLDGDVKDASKGDGVAALYAIANADKISIDTAPCYSSTTHAGYAAGHAYDVGCNIYLKRPDGMEPRRLIGALHPAVDVLGAGHVIAPSAWSKAGHGQHVSGPTLVEALTANTLPILSDAIRRRIEAGRKPAPIVVEHSPSADLSSLDDAAGKRERANAVKVLENECAALLATTSGRNNALNNAAHTIGTLVGPHRLGDREAAQAILDAARCNGYVDKDGEETAKATITSGLQAGMKKPRPLLPPPIDTAQIDKFFDSKPLDIQQQPTSFRASAMHYLFPKDCANDLTSNPYVIKDFISAGDLGCIIGQPGCGKSVLAPHLAYAVAQGRRVFGRRVKQGRVMYIAAEDGNGMEKRIKVLKQKHGDTDNLVLVKNIGNLTEHGTSDEENLVQAVEVGRPSLIIIDTLAAAFAGIDENTSEGMGRVLTFMRRLASFGAAVLIIHHPSKDRTGPRGHSSFFGAIDVAMELSRTERTVRAEPLLKNRNGSADIELSFTIETENLAIDEDGEMITAVYAKETMGGKPSSLDKYMLEEALDAIGDKEIPRHPLAFSWVGKIIGPIFGYDRVGKGGLNTHNKETKKIINIMIDERHLENFEKHDFDQGRPVPMVKVAKVNNSALPTPQERLAAGTPPPDPMSQAST